MGERLDHSDAVIALSARYFAAMLDADEAALRQIFHPKASVIGNIDGSLDFASLDEFIATTPEAKTGTRPFDCRVEEISLVGDTAVVKVGNYSYGEWYTDYLSMVNCDGEWRIVAKVFYSHPSSS